MQNCIWRMSHGEPPIYKHFAWGRSIPSCTEESSQEAVCLGGRARIGSGGGSRSWAGESAVGDVVLWVGDEKT